MTRAGLVCLLGGSFNPPHTGHLRMALEVYETLRPERFFFVPSARPPHKSAGRLLPFSLRAALLERCTFDLPGLEVSRVEAERQGLSFTADTLEEFAHRFAPARLAFIMGSGDLFQLHSWSRWFRLPELADLVVVQREGHLRKDVYRAVLALWPDAAAHAPDRNGLASWTTGSGRVLFLEQPRLDISSSLVRRRWLAGRSIDFLVPDAVREELTAQAETVRRIWQAEEAAGSCRRAVETITPPWGRI